MVTSNNGLLVELQAEIIELEGEIPDQATRDRLFAIPKKLFTEAQDYIRTGNAREARLTINCACTLLERGKKRVQEVGPPAPTDNSGRINTHSCGPANRSSSRRTFLLVLCLSKISK